MTDLPLVGDLTPSHLQTIADDRGTLVVAECGRHVPFPIARTFVVTDVRAGETRGHHAHKRCNQLLVCLAGRLMVVLDDGEARRIVTLAQPGDALHIPPGMWAEQTYEAPGSTLMVLCDLPYDESDYLRDHEGFLAWRAHVAKEKV